MLLSVVIPTLNKPNTAELIGERVAELLPDIPTETVIVTPHIPSSSRETVRFLQETRSGIYSAYTQGIKAARGTYVWLLGDDDIPLDGLQVLTLALQSATVDLIVAPVIYSNGRRYRVSKSRLHLLLRNWCQQGVIYRRSLLLKYPLYSRLRIQADHHSNVLINADPEVHKTFAMKPICLFGAEGASSRSGDEEFRRLRPLLARRTLGIASYSLFCLWNLAANTRRTLLKKQCLPVTSIHSSLNSVANR